MLCPRCGAELFPGMMQCGECGASVASAAAKVASITVTAREARQGAFKTLNMPRMTGPARFRIKPGTRDGEQILVNSAVFSDPEFGNMVIPVRVTVHVRKSPLGAIALVALLLLAASFGMGIRNIADALKTEGPPKVQVQTPSTAPTIPSISRPVEETQEVLEQPQEATEQVVEVVETETPQEVTETLGSSIPHFDKRPFLHQLNDNMLKNLEAIYNAAMDFQPSVEFPCEMSASELEYLTTLMNTEFPELMQLDNTISTTYYTNADNVVTKYELPYSLDRREYEKRYKATMEVIQGLVDQCQGMTDWEKEKFVFDYITENCTYNMQGVQTYSAYGTLVERVAKCDGISLAFKWIMEEMGITCVCITGDPTVGDIGHAWNIIQLDGAYYNVDVTMDVRKSDDLGPVMYKALNVTDEMVLQTYVLSPAFSELLQIPKVNTMEKSYHVEHGTYVTSGGEWRTLIGQSYVTLCQTGVLTPIQFETRADFDACLAGISDAVNEAASEAGISGGWQYYYSEEFRTICVLTS